MSGWKDDDAVTITYRTLCQAQAEAATAEQERIIKRLTDYLALTEVSEQVEGAESNSDWSNGYQSALALIKGKN